MPNEGDQIVDTSEADPHWSDYTELQIQRYHHIQAQSRGLVGILLTLIVITISVYSVISPLPGIPTSLEAYTGPVSGLGIYPLTGLLTASFSGAMAILWLYWGAYCWLVALHKLFRVMLQREESFSLHASLIPGLYTRSIFISELMNTEFEINRVHGEFVRGALRIAFGLFFIISAYQMHTYASQQRLVSLFAMNFVFALPGIVISNVTNWVHEKVTPDTSEGFFDEETGAPNNEILGQYQNRLSDNLLSIITSLSALFILICWLISWALQLAS